MLIVAQILFKFFFRSANLRDGMVNIINSLVKWSGTYGSLNLNLNIHHQV